MKTLSVTNNSWDRVALGACFAVVLMALIVIVGWHAHIRAAVQIFQGSVPMQYNTALCFLALGAAGIGLVTQRRVLLLTGAGLTALMGLAVVLEYATGVSFGIDTLFFYPWEYSSIDQPGRMALTTAISFFLTGCILLIHSVRKGTYILFGVVNLLPLSLALSSIVGYAFQITYIMPFELGSQMAIQSAATLLVYCIAMLGYAWTHSEGQQIDERLRESEEKFRTILNRIDDGYFEVDLAGSYVFVNDSFCKTAGREARELLGVNYRQFFDGELRQLLFDTYNSVYKTGESTKGFEYEITRKDGTKVYVEESVNLRRDAEGLPIGFMGIRRDCTDRKRVENEREVISEVIQSVNLTVKLDELLQKVHQSLKKVLYAENCCVALYDKQTGLFEAPFFVDLVEENPFPVALTKNCTAKVFSSGQPLLMNEAIFAELLDHGEVELIGRPAPSFLAVPLISPSETIGVIVLQHYELENVYNQRDVEFLSAVAAQLALAIERKRAEEALIESDTRFRDLFYDAPVGYHELDIEGRITGVNTTELSMLGYSSEEMIGHHVWEFIEDAETARAVFKEKVAGRKPLRNVERSFRRKDGTYMAVQLDDQILKDPGGRFTGIRATLQDIGERKQSERALKDSEERYRELFENASDLVCTMDLNGNYSSLNKSGERLTGYKQSEAIKLNMATLVTPETIGVVREMMSRKLDEDITTTYEIDIIRKDGQIVTLEISSRLLHQGGKIIGIQAIGRDITQRKQVEAELKLARDTALESVRLKSEFLANMSHEIRTPMNGVIGMTGLLLDTDLTSDQREYTETINFSADALLIIIDDILDFSKIESGLLRFEKIDFELRGVVEAPVELLAERAQAKGLELASIVYRDVPTALRGDPGRLRQVLTNLIGNAIKFTDQGEVVVSVTKISESDERAMLRFEVTDTGIGISTESQQGLFHAFTQADGSTTRKYGGTGLGLAISKQLVELMGGEIGIESVPGAGSTFWFTARFEKQNIPASIETELPGTLSGVRILIVDDNATNRRILNHHTSSWGMITTEAESGSQALELLKAGTACGEPYNIALLDLMMPDMDGFQLAAVIKSDPTIDSVALVLLPSFGRPGHGEKARQIGITAYLQKPVRQSQLHDCLTRIVAQPNGEPIRETRLVTRHSMRESEVRHKESTLSNLRILVAEDNLVNQKVALGQLYNLGYRADAVSNGIELLEALEKGYVDIILMDCQMPEMDGFVATAEIRRREGTSRHTTIIAMTANALEGDENTCLAAGMDDYISKPVKADVLRLKLEQWVKPRESGKRLKSQIKPTQSVNSGVIDQAQLAMLREIQQPGEADFVTELIDLFLTEAVLDLKGLHEASLRDDAVEIQQLTHRLKGSSANLGATQMSILCGVLETKGPSTDATDMLKELENEFGLVRTALTAERRETVD